MCPLVCLGALALQEVYSNNEEQWDYIWSQNPTKLMSNIEKYFTQQVDTIIFRCKVSLQKYNEFRQKTTTFVS